MHRLLILLFLLLSANPVWAQDTDEGDSTEADRPNAPEAAEDAEDDEELYAEEDEDVFIPSEDVKFGQSIPFPTDI